MWYRKIYYLIHSTKWEQICLFFTYVLFRLCFLCVGDLFLARSGSVLMNNLLFLCLCPFLVWDHRVCCVQTVALPWFVYPFGGIPASQQFIRLPFVQVFNSCSNSSFGPNSCLFCCMWVSYIDLDCLFLYILCVLYNLYLWIYRTALHMPLCMCCALVYRSRWDFVFC
jgi:hypothetical protein